VAGLNPEQAKLVLGGEVAVWSETIDSTNFDDFATGQNRSQLDAAPRLNEFRERMVLRGVRSSPVQMTFCTQGKPEECEYAP
jgi:hexosaminidase